MARRPKTKVSDQEYEALRQWKLRNPKEYKRLFNGQYLYTLTDAQLLFLKNHIKSIELRQAYGS